LETEDRQIQPNSIKIMNTTLDFLKEEGSLVGYSLITKPDEAVLKEMV
jgi:hypothetical protein